MRKATIQFCVMWDYRPHAARVADELRKLGLDVELIEGRGGVFDVTVDGKLVFSKADKGRFPATGEMAGLIGK